MMVLPSGAARCLEKLEAAGFPCYAVGGCVRDALLGRVPSDYDLCTAATPDQTKQVFSGFPLVLAGEKHGTVGVIINGEVVEITTWRTEGGYRDNRHPDWVKFVPTIEEDLARRDFTVNAMAWSPVRGLRDPFGGQNDLKNKVLRAVGDPATRFREDALRILRGVRFGLRYGLTAEENTREAMVSLVPLLDNLAKERVFDELCKLLPLVTPEDLLTYAPILTRAVPELAPTLGFDQRSPHHAYDVYTHTTKVVGAVPPELPLRWAALLHDVGKPPCFSQDETGRGHFKGHAEAGAEIAGRALRHLKAPNDLRERVVLLIEKHMLPLAPDKKLLRRQLSRLGPEVLRQLLALQEADDSGKGVPEDPKPDFAEIRAVLSQILEEEGQFTLKDLAVSGRDMMALGLTGPAIGEALNFLLTQVLEERLPNEKEALLAAVKHNI